MWLSGGGREVAPRLSLEKHKKEQRSQIAIKKRQMKIIEHIQRNGQITTGESAKMFNISRQAALKELSRIAELEAIKPEGKERGAYYAIA